MTPTDKFPESRRMQGVRRRLARWRQTRPHQRAPIPPEVWAAAVRLARQHGLYQTARALPISYSALKAHVAGADGTADIAGPPTFVELAPVPPRQGPECVIEFDVPPGRPRLRVRGLALADIVALTRALGWREA